jgi:hypothetical protein
MGVRNAEQETLRRLDSKTLDAQLRQVLVSGLNCSPFEADAVIAAAQEVYFPFFDAAGEPRTRPGYVSLVAVAADEPAGKASSIAASRASRSSSIAGPPMTSCWRAKDRGAFADSAFPSCASKRSRKASC